MLHINLRKLQRSSLHLSYILFFVFFIISCGGKEEIDTSLYKDKTTFENYLTERINSYVEECSSDLIGEQTNILTLQPVRMIKHSFFEEDDFRKYYWYQTAIDNGLNSDSISSLINHEIDIYNAYHHDTPIEHINVVPFYQDDVIDDMAFNLIKKLEYFGSYDLIDIIVGSFISFGVGYVFGFIIGFLVNVTWPDTSDEFNDSMAKGVGYLFFILWVLLFCWLTYKYIVISLELENVISSNIINAVIF